MHVYIHVQPIGFGSALLQDHSACTYVASPSNKMGDWRLMHEFKKLYSLQKQRVYVLRWTCTYFSAYSG